MSCSAAQSAAPSASSASSLPTAARRQGLPEDELERMVSATFKDFDSIGHEDLCMDLVSLPSAFEHDAPQHGQPRRPPSRLAASLLRKVKSHASSFLRIPSGPQHQSQSQSQYRQTPRPASSPVPSRRRSRTKSMPKAAASDATVRAVAPPVPLLAREPRSIDLGRPSTPVVSFSRPLTPEPCPASSLPSTPAAKLRARNRLSSLLGASPLRPRSCADPCEASSCPPTPPPKSPRSRPSASSRSLRNRSVGGQDGVPPQPLSIYSPHPDSIWTPALTSASPIQSSPPSTLSSVSQSCSPLTPATDLLFDSADDPFRKPDVVPVPPSPQKRPRASRGKAAPKLTKLFIPPPSDSASLLPPHFPAETLASASQTSLPSVRSEVFLPFPLPPHSPQDAITIRVPSPTFPPARPPPTRPLPRVPEGPHVTVEQGPHTAPASQTSFNLSSSRPSRKRSRRPFDASHSRPSREVFLQPASSPKRPRSPFPLLERAKKAQDGDGVREAVDMMLEENVSFTNPWNSSPRTDDGGAFSDSDVDARLSEVQERSRKKMSVASSVTSMTSASARSLNSVLTPATSVSPYASPDACFRTLSDSPHDVMPRPLPSPPRTPARSRTSFDHSMLAARSDSISRNASYEARPASDARPTPARPSFESDVRPDSFYTAMSHSQLSSAHARARDCSPPAAIGHGSMITTAPAIDISLATDDNPNVPFPRAPTPALSVVSEMLPGRDALYAYPARSATSLGVHPSKIGFGSVSSLGLEPVPEGRTRLPPRTLSPAPASPSKAQTLTPSPARGKRRSFLLLPSIPRIAPLDLGVHLQTHGSPSGTGKRRVLGSGWFD